ncbi:MAG: hypothetical protein ACMUHM_09605, partial [Thermoplasmatota archaeon]
MMMEGAWSRTGRAAFLVSILLLTILSAISFVDEATEEADAILPISAQFYFAADQGFRTGNMIEIQTGPGQTGQVIVNGTLEFYRSAKLLRTVIMIDLKFSSTHPEITGSVFPPIIDIRPQAKLSHYPITVNIQIAPMTKFSTPIGSLINVTVFGTWEARYQSNEILPFANGDIDPYPLFVNVRPYHYIYMTFDPVMLSLSPGESGWAKCVVKNNGNGFERVELSMPGALAYAKSGWIFEFEDTVLDIGPDAEAYTRIKITSPRKIEPKYHMEMYDFSVMAVSYYSSYQVKDGVLDVPWEYETGIFVQINGIDFLYVPWMWAVVLYLVIALILFNLGINPLIMKKRKAKDPGFIGLYKIITDPKRRELARARRAERRKLKGEIREQEKLL